MRLVDVIMYLTDCEIELVIPPFEDRTCGESKIFLQLKEKLFNTVFESYKTGWVVSERVNVYPLDAQRR